MGVPIVVFVSILLSVVSTENGTTDGIKSTEANNVVNNIADSVIEALGVKTDEGNLVKLKDKIAKVNTYVVDKDKYAELLLNETRETDLNETNFYNALKENDDFRFLTEKEPKNLYLKLKQNMNRDDIEAILAGKNGKALNSGRKFFGAITDKREIDDAIDKLLGETPRDNHKFEEEYLKSPYWDPQGELEELRHYHRQDGRRIYRGERTTIRYFPFVVSVHVMGLFWCGGALYWYDLVLTSASCLQLMHNNRFFRENPRVLQVRVGSNHSRVSGEVIDASEVYFHPGYNPRTLRHNIAIIRLRYHVQPSYHRLPKFIEISHNDNLAPATGEVMVFGWGVTKMSQKLRYEPIYLQRKLLPVYPNMFCKQVYGDKFVTTTMFCAGTMTTGEGACDHDAGGPAIMGGKLYGIISFGPSICGFPNAPTVLTLVGAYSDWIETVNESMPSYYRGHKATTTTQRPKVLSNLVVGEDGHLYDAAYAQLTSESAPKAIVVGKDTTSTPTESTTSETTITEATDETETTTEGSPPSALRLRRKRKKHSPFVLV